jgi:hypothetical protein
MMKNERNKHRFDQVDLFLYKLSAFDDGMRCDVRGNRQCFLYFFASIFKGRVNLKAFVAEKGCFATTNRVASSPDGGRNRDKLICEKREFFIEFPSLRFSLLLHRARLYLPFAFQC